MDHIRELLEPVAAKMAAERIDITSLEQIEARLQALNREAPDESDYLKLVELDEQLHDLILRASGNQRMHSIITGFRKTASLIRLRATVSRFQSELCEHQQIIEALKNRDADVVEKAMLRHIQASKENRYRLL